MQKWLITADTKKVDIHEYFTKSKDLTWIQHANYEIGDIVYIYCRAPHAKIMYKTVVEEESLHYDDTDYKYTLLRFVEYVDNEDLSLENLRNHGLKNPPMKSMKIRGDLEEYIDKYFIRIPDKTNKFRD